MTNIRETLQLFCIAILLVVGYYQNKVIQQQRTEILVESQALQNIQAQQILLNQKMQNLTENCKSWSETTCNKGAVCSTTSAVPLKDKKLR
jgi:hypothetical protein